ncbi:hypothetical protein N7G274_010114 [Stereocaulon virgatum]|uniref:Uncharacterized protein n=1 Tax=Stereocaulon virgatum TaxID=373712 RepID=A0ABR4A1C0_9LECA
MSSPIPVVVCGQQAIILQDVKDRLLPEYEMIHGILHPIPGPGPSPLPALLRGEKPNDPENIGTKAYSRPRPLS